MGLYNVISELSMTLLGSTLHKFEMSHTEYSSSSSLSITTLYEDVGFKPFLVTLYDLENTKKEFMTSLSDYVGTYYLHALGNEELKNPQRVVIDLPIHAEDWKGVRVIIQDKTKEIPIVLDTTAPNNLCVVNGKIDICSGLYKSINY